MSGLGVSDWVFGTLNDQGCSFQLIKTICNELFALGGSINCLGVIMVLLVLGGV